MSEWTQHDVDQLVERIDAEYAPRRSRLALASEALWVGLLIGLLGAGAILRQLARRT